MLEGKLGDALAGDGGDELFAGNSRYAKQMVFERYGAVPVALREEPEGAQSWNKRARRLQGQLVSRWAGAYA